MTRDDVQAAVTNCAFELRFASPFGQPDKLPDDSVHPDQPQQINHTFYVLSMVMERVRMVWVTPSPVRGWGIRRLPRSAS